MDHSPVRPSERFLIFGSPAIEETDIREIVDCLKSGWIGTGPRVATFEDQFKSYKNAAHAVALSSCTAALFLSMKVAGVQEGDEIITTPMTFCASVNSIIHCGATPVLADVDPETMNIDPDRVREKITPRTKAVLPVHFAGRSCRMDALMEIAVDHNLRIIEDCAHAIETEYHGQKAGTWGDFGCFSFYVTKNVISGEGGMVLAARKEHADRIKILALHGLSHDAWRRFGDEGYKHYFVTECGYKFNMMDLQAALGIRQLERVEQNWIRRREIWNTYQQAFESMPVGRPADPEPETRHAYHLYTLMIDPDRTGMTRDQFVSAMTAENIGVGIHYLSIPEHPYYRDRYGWSPDEYPHAMQIGRQTVSLPLSPKLTEQDLSDVIRAVNKVLSR